MDLKTIRDYVPSVVIAGCVMFSCIYFTLITIDKYAACPARPLTSQYAVTPAAVTPDPVPNISGTAPDRFYQEVAYVYH